MPRRKPWTQWCVNMSHHVLSSSTDINKHNVMSFKSTSKGFKMLLWQQKARWFWSVPLPICWAQVSQYSAYKDSKQLQQYGRPSFMMYRWPPSTVSHSKQQKCFICQCLPSASVHSSAKIIWGKRRKESGLGLRGDSLLRSILQVLFSYYIFLAYSNSLAILGLLWLGLLIPLS